MLARYFTLFMIAFSNALPFPNPQITTDKIMPVTTRPTTVTTRPTTVTTRPTTVTTRPVTTRPVTTRPTTRPTAVTTRPTAVTTRPTTRPTAVTTRPTTRPTAVTTRPSTVTTRPVTTMTTRPSTVTTRPVTTDLPVVNIKCTRIFNSMTSYLVDPSTDTICYFNSAKLPDGFVGRYNMHEIDEPDAQILIFRYEGDMFLNVNKKFISYTGGYSMA